MILYHGSDHIIEKPVFGEGKPYNDYGLGFYCTDNLEMAKEWGVSKNQNGYANCYGLDCTGLKILNLNESKFCILNWLAVLLKNREFDIPSALALEAKEYILKHENWKLDDKEYFEGGVSGYNNSVANRDVLQEALVDAEKHEYDILVV